MLHDLGDIATACALHVGIIYAMNLSYSQELKHSLRYFRKSSSNWMLPDYQPRYRCSKTNFMSEPTSITRVCGVQNEGLFFTLVENKTKTEK